MNKKQLYKEKARQKAIEWQNDFQNHNYSYEELAEWQSYFEKIARQYGLKKEFIENGILSNNLYDEKECANCHKTYNNKRSKFCSKQCEQHYYYINSLEQRKEYKRKKYLDSKKEK